MSMYVNVLMSMLLIKTFSYLSVLGSNLKDSPGRVPSQVVLSPGVTGFSLHLLCIIINAIGVSSRCWGKCFACYTHPCSPGFELGLLVNPLAFSPL